MKIKVEGSGLKIGVDNSLTEAIISGKWGIVLTFHDDNYENKFILNIDESKFLAEKINNAIISTEKVNNARRK